MNFIFKYVFVSSDGKYTTTWLYDIDDTQSNFKVLQIINIFKCMFRVLCY